MEEFNKSVIVSSRHPSGRHSFRTSASDSWRWPTTGYRFGFTRLDSSPWTQFHTYRYCSVPSLCNRPCPTKVPNWRKEKQDCLGKCIVINSQDCVHEFVCVGMYACVRALVCVFVYASVHVYARVCACVYACVQMKCNWLPLANVSRCVLNIIIKLRLLIGLCSTYRRLGVGLKRYKLDSCLRMANRSCQHAYCRTELRDECRSDCCYRPIIQTRNIKFVINGNCWATSVNHLLQ